jgi:hypothetical protein
MQLLAYSARQLRIGHTAAAQVVYEEKDRECVKFSSESPTAWAVEITLL